MDKIDTLIALIEQTIALQDDMTSSAVLEYADIATAVDLLQRFREELEQLVE